MSLGKQYIKKVVVLDDKSSSLARAKRLIMLRNLANLSRKQLCELSSINVHTLKGWEVGRYGGLPHDGAEKIIKCIAQKGVTCSLEWLLHEIGAGPKVITDVATARVDTQKQASTTKIDEQQLLDELMFFRRQHDDAATFQVEDDGMSPFYNRGEYVAGIKCYGKQVKLALGRDCVVQCGDGQIFLRNLRKGLEKGKFTLACHNAQTSVPYPTMYNVEITSAAPVIRVYRKGC